MGSGDVAIPCPLVISMKGGPPVAGRWQSRIVVFGICSRVQGLCHARRREGACDASPSSYILILCKTIAQRSAIHQEAIRTRDAPHHPRRRLYACALCIKLGFFNLVSLDLI